MSPSLVKRASPAILIAVLALLLTGCGSTDVPGVSPTSGDVDQTDTTSGDLDYPRGETDLVLRVEQSGGFLPVEAVFTSVPGFSLYGDGRVIFSGPIPEIFPGPALPNLLQVQLSEDGARQLLLAAVEAGLAEDEPDLGQPPIADAPTTVFTLNLNGREHTVQAYALGYEPEFSPEDSPPGEAPGSAPGTQGVPDSEGAPVFQLTEEQREARRRLLDFQTQLMDLRGWLGEEAGPEEPYRFQAVDVLAQEANQQPPDPSEVEPIVQQWPLADLAGLGETEARGRRFLVAGEELETLRPQIAQANMLTLWESEGQLYALYFRPLLPDEPPSAVSNSN